MQNDIIFGIHHCVKKAAESTTKDKLEDKDYEISAKEEYTLTRDGTDFQFKDYAPSVFHKVREVLGVSADEFLESWVIDDSSKMEESTARSGSMFYKTPDTKYLFKTILHPEVGAMVDLLKDYYEHLCNEPKTFVVKIYGLFRITYPNFLNSQQTWVLIMGNGFPPDIKMDEVFDLKGRTPKKGKGPTDREPVSKGARKDNEITRKLLFYPYSKQVYIEQLEKDVEKHNIMDYSLLVGIHKLTAEEKAVIPLKLKGERKERKGKGKGKKSDGDKAQAKHFKKVLKNPHARNPETGDDEIIFLGIIDNLTTFNVKKKIANTCKKLLWSEETLSTVRSEFYASRFLAWMTKTLLADETECADCRPEEVLFEEYVQKIRTFSQRSLGPGRSGGLSARDKPAAGADVPKKTVSDMGTTKPIAKGSKLDLPVTSVTKTKSTRSQEDNKRSDRTASPSRSKSARSPKSTRRLDKTDSKASDGKELKEEKETKEMKEKKDKETKDMKDNETKDSKDKEAKEKEKKDKETKDMKDKEIKDSKDKEAKEKEKKDKDTKNKETKETKNGKDKEKKDKGDKASADSPAVATRSPKEKRKDEEKVTSSNKPKSTREKKDEEKKKESS